jgi:hypothetical protein
MRLRRFRRRLFWTGVIFALMLIWLTVQVMRAAGAIASAARRPRRARHLAISPPLWRNVDGGLWGDALH